MPSCSVSCCLCLRKQQHMRTPAFSIYAGIPNAHTPAQTSVIPVVQRSAFKPPAASYHAPKRGALLYTAGQNHQPCPRRRQPDGGARRRASLRGTPGQRRRHPPSSRWETGFLMGDWFGVRTSGCRPCSISASSKNRVSAGYHRF